MFKSQCGFVLAVFLLSLSCWNSLQAQNQAINRDTTKKVQIKYTKKLRFTKIKGELVKQLIDSVEVQQGNTIMYCDSALVKDNNIEAHGNVLIEQGDSLQIFANETQYKGDQRKAELIGEVVLTDSKMQMFTPRLDYYLDSKVGIYTNGATLEDSTTQLRSKRGYYYVKTKDAYFKDSVYLYNTQYNIIADTLRFNTDTRIAYFLGPTYIILKDSSQIYCEEGFYDTKNNYAEFTKNPSFQKDKQFAQADKIRYDGTNKITYL